MAFKETKEKVGFHTSWNGGAVEKHVLLFSPRRKREERAEAWAARAKGERTLRSPDPACVPGLCLGLHALISAHVPKHKVGVRIPPAGQRTVIETG